MDAHSYSAALTELRTVRDAIKKARAELTRLESDRDKRVVQLAAYEKAKAERIAPASGLSVADVVTLAPALAPDRLAADSETAPQSPAPSEAITTAADETGPKPAPQPEAAAPAKSTEHPRPASPTPAEATAPAPPAEPQTPRSLPAIAEGTAGDTWFTHTPGLASTRPNFTQQARSTVFLDTNTGILVHRNETHHLDLGAASAADILTAVFHTLPKGVERIYITAGDPWHRDTDRYPYLRDAVAAWLNAPTPGWRTDTGRGRDRMAGHFVHARNPVGRYQREIGDSHVEIRSVGEWFDIDGDDPHTVRDAFVLLWQALRRHWSDAVLMGSPSQTGRDLWTRTIPTRGQWSDGFPVLSEELRGLLHTTAGQGRNELLTPPRVPEQLPQLVEYDRTFAYAKHTWKSPVGTPRRITAPTFAAWSEKEQMRALYGCGHWHVRVTVPDGWNHVGLLPAPAPGDRAWHYPAAPGTTFTTWAGGPEIHTALTNPLTPWKVEILDGILWDDGKPLDDWAKKLKDAWTNLATQAHFHTDPQQSRAAHLASRAVRAILLYGIGSFAQRPRTVTGTTPRHLERDVPADAEIIGFDDDLITWQKPTGFSRDPNAHPEWAAAIWSGARAALLTQRHRDDNTHAGALHAPPGSVIAFRTDALYLTQLQNWPYHHQPGDYLLKGHLTGPLTAPTSEEDLLALRDAGRTALTHTTTGA
ncbi:MULTISPECIES: hypothetical protein [Streptomyces]|uniref:hypothetical protein n=1 Tax=Streptomyces TaxID=1883 RepID=UPI001E4D9E1A|nr:MULTISPECIES: hypothetical protein [Streptomyces]UFQ13547.1 hypothetical protein J2N69_00070 [Streptomyces huasconensis]UFQ19987.1 hypothetical protein J2N69_36330 [Streptomyces huasconensis]WCL83142.1 hypothetical protein PPN52_00055 [Streptomyces sp. JCM 35825]